MPAVLTITGSGQQKRDERVPFPGLEKYGLMRPKQVFPNLNHLFLPAKTAAMEEYSKLETAVVPAEVLGDWLAIKLKVK